MMRKLIFIAAALALALSVSACASPRGTGFNSYGIGLN